MIARETFFVTDHYPGHPVVLMRFGLRDLAQLPALLEQAWREAAPKLLLKKHTTGFDIQS